MTNAARQVKLARVTDPRSFGVRSVATLCLVGGLMAGSAWIATPHTLEDFLPRPPVRRSDSATVLLVLRAADCEAYAWFARQLRRRLTDERSMSARVVVVRSMFDEVDRNSWEASGLLAPGVDGISQSWAPIRGLPRSLYGGPNLVLLDTNNEIRVTTLPSPSPAVLLSHLDHVIGMARTLRF